MLICMSIYDTIGQVPIGLVHRLIAMWHPWLKSLGCIIGSRANAVSAYAQGHRSCLVIPGGAEEAIEGFENAYRVCWYDIIMTSLDLLC